MSANFTEIEQVVLNFVINAQQAIQTAGVVENGRVIESGTFDELVAKGGHFADLARAQFMVQENARASVTAAEAAATAAKSP